MGTIIKGRMSAGPGIDKVFCGHCASLISNSSQLSAQLGILGSFIITLLSRTRQFSKKSFNLMITSMSVSAKNDMFQTDEVH